MNDGNVVTEVVSKTNDMLICEIKNDGIIKSNCSINIPDADFNIRFLSDYDKETIRFAVSMKADYLALSHVRSDLDILDVNDLLIELEDDRMQIISKIENKDAVDEIEGIIKVSDGVMVSRGDLGIELQLEKIPSIQKRIANYAKENEKICIIANEMLSSMQENPRPTRAEVSDVANAVIDGTDAIMLSSETAIGRYPVETVKIANKIIDEIENEIDYNNLLLEFNRNEDLPIEDAICYSTVDCANRVDAKVIVCSTITGKTAKKISYYRPSSSVLAVSPDERTVTGLAINYGIIPVKVPMLDTTEDILKVSIEEAKKQFDLKEKDKIVIAGSFNTKTDNYTNFLKIEEI